MAKQTPAQRMDALRKELRASPTGSKKLKFLDDHRVPVDFANGKGSKFHKGRVTIDTALSRQEASAALVHEGHHAQSRVTGNSGNILKQGRSSYVNTMLREESSATVAEFMTKNELRAAGQTVSPAGPLEQKYNAARNQAAAEYRRTNANVDPSELKSAVDGAGYARVFRAFRDGEVRTSGLGKRQYPAHYGDAWDAAHRK